MLPSRNNNFQSMESEEHPRPHHQQSHWKPVISSKPSTNNNLSDKGNGQEQKFLFSRGATSKKFFKSISSS